MKLREKIMRKKWYIYFAAIAISMTVAACSSYNYSTEITNSSDNEKSVEVYFFGIPSDKLEETQIITYDDFWMKVFNSKGEYPKNKKAFYFGPGTPKTQNLDYNDSVWSIWKNSDMDYLCIAAYSPDFTDSSRKDVDWKKIIQLKHRNWWGLFSEKLKVDIKDGMPSVED